jgi:hypothetical protein
MVEKKKLKKKSTVARPPGPPGLGPPPRPPNPKTMMQDYLEKEKQKEKQLEEGTDPFLNFLKNTYTEYEKGTFDDLNLIYSRIPNQRTLLSFVNDWQRQFSIGYVKNNIKPLEGEFLVTHSTDELKPQLSILTNYRWIYKQKGSHKIIKLQDIKSVKIVKKMFKILYKLKMKKGEEKVIEFKGGPNQDHFNFAIKINHSNLNK